MMAPSLSLHDQNCYTEQLFHTIEPRVCGRLGLWRARPVGRGLFQLGRVGDNIPTLAAELHAEDDEAPTHVH
jgi:hypothetical protein